MSNEALFFDDDMMGAENDAVVSEMPIFLNPNAGEALVALQYPTRKANDNHPLTRISLKPNAQILETSVDPELPMHFIDSSNGAGRVIQKYSGVMNNTKARFAVGYVANDALHLSFVPRTGQLRPEFPAKVPLLNTAMLQQTAKPAESANLRSVQMSVKSTSQELPKHSVALGFWREANKEDYEPVELAKLSDAERKELLTTDETAEVPVNNDVFVAIL